MRLGSWVVYLPDPALYGRGMIDEIKPNGRIVVSFTDCREEFAARELELVTRSNLGASFGAAA